MAILTSTYPTNEHGKVIGLYMTMVGIGAIVGPMSGGAAVALLGWRAVFFMSAPLGLISLLLGITVLDRYGPVGSARQPRSSGFDWPGALLSAAALVIFLLAMTSAYRVGWTSPVVISAFTAAVALAAAFLYWETRCPQPMLPLELFRRRLFSLGSSASFFSFLAGTSVFFLIPFYLQDVIGLSPARAGLIIGPTALCFALFGPISGKLSDRYGSGRFEVTGLILLGASMAILSRITESSPLYLVITALVLMGSGMATFYSPNASSVLSVVERSRYGVATAFLNMVRNTANVTGIGLATAIVTARMAALGFEPSLDAVAAGGPGVERAFMEGLGLAFLMLGAFTILALVLTVLKHRERTGAPANPTRSEATAGASTTVE
jgi:MFS family permease